MRGESKIRGDAAGKPTVPIMEFRSTPPEHSEESRYYRELASAIRTRLPTLHDEEVINELYLLATHYERLAEFTDSLGSLKGLTWPDIRTRAVPGRRRLI